MQTRPEPSAPLNTCLPLCEVSRALIELSEQQMQVLGPESLRSITHNEPAMAQIIASSEAWRRRYLENRAAMKTDLVAWMTLKRAFNHFTPAGFELWAVKVKYHI